MIKPQPKSFTTTPLGIFCGSHKISLPILSSLLGNVSKTTSYRLLTGELDKPYDAKLKKLLSTTLPEYLFKKGMNKADIDEQLKDIFQGEYQPMISQRLELTPDQCRHFGFHDAQGRPADPFSTPPQSRDEVFINADLQQIVDRVIDAIKYPAFVAVTGEIGSGKSTLRALIEDYVAAQQNVHVIWPEFFDQAKITAIQIARAILKHFGVQRIPRYSEDLGALVKKTLEVKHRSGERICLAFDECHRMSDDALSSLKNFFEMGSGGFQRYLGVVLLGQPLFEVRLNEARFRELLERIIILPMPDFQQSAPGYLDHRLSLVGRSVDAIFDTEAVELICRQATTPLALGNIANEALRLTKEEFNEPKVIGAAIKTRMFFDTRSEPQAFTRRAAS